MRNLINLKRLSIFLAGGILVFGLGFRFTPLLFPIQKEDIEQKSFHSVKFYDRDGNLLQEVLSKDSRSLHVSIDQVSPYFLKAIIASEDKNFYRHKGIDYLAILRAIYQNIKSKEIVSGASTITLQLARMLNPGQRTVIKKTKEAYFAYRLEAGMDKKSILEEYINRIPMGSNLYGVESAAKAYFGLSASDLTLAQATFPAAQVVAKIGVERFLDRLNEYEFYSLNQDADYYGIGLALGGGEVTLYELVRAYMCLARMGSFIPIREILTVNGQPPTPFTKGDGKSETDDVSAVEKTISTLTMNYLISDILSDRFARASEFGFNSVLNLPFPCAVKTGTSF